MMIKNNYIRFMIVVLFSLTVHATPVSVPAGGTDLSSTTAYAILCGGTTSTNALQQIAAGSNTTLPLVSGGAGTLPSFAMPGVGAGGTGLTTMGGAGALLYASGTAVLAALPIGTANQILRVSSGFPAWINAFPGYTGGTGFAYAGTVGTLAGSQTPLGTILISTGTAPSAVSANATYSTGLGYQALQSMGSTVEATAIGSGALKNYNDTSATGSVQAVGYYAGNTMTSGYSHAAMGYYALGSETTGHYCCAFGAGALQSSTTVSGVDGFGYNAANLLTTGAANMAFGYAALANVTSGTCNTAVGYNALNSCTGSKNTAVGYYAGSTATTGSNNVYLGYYAAPITATESNNLVIGTTNVTTACYIYGISGATASGGVQAYVNTAGQVGTVSSSKRFKTNIENVTEEEAHRLLDLNIVSFNFIKDPNEELQYGVIAEDVQDILPEMIVYDQGQPYTVQYHKLVPLIIKEVQIQEAEKDEIEKNITLLQATLAAMQMRISMLKHKNDDEK